METQEKGDFTEAAVITELKRRAIPVSVPFGDNQRYDIVIETEENDLLKVQIKTGWVADGTIEFHGKSQHTNASGNVYEKYDGDVDCFLVYCDEVGAVYLIDEDEFETSMSLRIADPEQVHETINWADEYEFDERWPPE